ncbi:MAG TPA: hypothetical protein PKO30_07300 [Prolixibacteraceae bacterium]|nr:hypothetical protein [Prolixibacteraceae bacterium]
MKKLAANYILSDSGLLLKNGILIAEDDGNVIEVVDTKGDLDEIAQLTFHNGILITNNLYNRTNSVYQEDNEMIQFINQKIGTLQQLTASEIIDIAKQTQAEFPELKTSEITIAVYSLLNSCFSRKEQPGVFLLVSSDLIGLHFKPQSCLKRIL